MKEGSGASPRGPLEFRRLPPRQPVPEPSLPEPVDLLDGVEPGGLADQPGRGAHGPLGKMVASRRAVAEFHALAGADEIEGAAGLGAM